MAAVTTPVRTFSPGLPHGRPLTRADLDLVPDDGHRYELLDGVLVVSPSPARRHQRAVLRLARLVDDSLPADLELLVAPFDVALADDTVLIRTSSSPGGPTSPNGACPLPRCWRSRCSHRAPAASTS